MAFNHVDASRLSGAYNEPCLPHHYHHHHHHGFIINSLWATPCNFPITSAVVFVDSPGYTSWNYPGFLEASRGTICFVGPLQETQSEQTKRRTCFLERSVFDLVKEHPYLDLTDPKLLGWYLSLTAQDRSIILDEGGFHRFLQRHPALGLTDHHVYVKFEYPNETSSLLSPSMSSSGHKYTSNTQNSLEMLQDNLKDHLCQQLVPQEDIFDTPSSGTDSPKPINMDPEGLEKCSLDLVLDQCFQKKNLEENSAMCGQSANIAANLAQANPLKSDQSCYNECYSEYCSCDSMESDDHDDSIENPIYLRGHPEPNRKKSTNDGPIQNKVGGEQDDRFKNILGEDTSMVCLDGKGTMGHQKDGHSGLAKAYREAAVDASDIIKPGRTPENISVPRCNAVIGPDLAQSSPVSTQTEAEAPETADKNVMTELQISDLNFVYQRFTKMKEDQKECLERISCLASALKKGCDCAHRAQRSELHLLALQYVVCRQHCWRLYCTSGEGLVSVPGDPTEHWSVSPPANMSGVLQKLEADYNEMKDQIMKGIPLDQLKPLSVNPENITAGATYTPAQMTANVLGIHPSLDPHKSETSEKDNGGSGNPRISPCQEQQTGNTANEGKRKTKRTVTAIHQDKISDKDSHKLLEIKTELNTSEAWFDAKEDLNQPEPAKEKPHSANDNSDETEGSSKEEMQCSIFCLPDDVTERDVMLWFKKYCPSDVIMTKMGNDLRVAVVSLPKIHAEAALKELKGFNAKGHPLKPESTEPKSTTAEPGTTGEESASALSGSASDTHGMVISKSPRAGATFVPQHFGTMGSFDTLMSQLRKLHPSIKRETIVEALIELRAQHRGHLIGLPLRKIRELASELLTRSETDANA